MISSIASRRHRLSALQKKLNLPVVERDVVVDPAVDGVMVSTRKALTQRVMMKEEEGDEKDPHRDQEEGVDPEIREIQEIQEIHVTREDREDRDLDLDREVEAAGEEAAAVGAEGEQQERRERVTKMMIHTRMTTRVRAEQIVTPGHRVRTGDRTRVLPLLPRCRRRRRLLPPRRLPKDLFVVDVGTLEI
jgi:hypothetical protein